MAIPLSNPHLPPDFRFIEYMEGPRMKITSAPLIVSMGWFSVRLIRGCYYFTLIFGLFFTVENMIDFRYLFDQT